MPEHRLSRGSPVAGPLGADQLLVAGALLGPAVDSAKAAEMAGRCRDRPCCASFPATSSKGRAVFVLPEGREWWLERVQDDTRGTVGLESERGWWADVGRVSHAADALSQWARGEARALLGLGPCGANCRDCPGYGHRCEGCPDTGFSRANG